MSNDSKQDNRSIFAKASDLCQEYPVSSAIISGTVTATAGSLAAAALAKKWAAKQAANGAQNALFGGGRGFFK